MASEHHDTVKDHFDAERPTGDMVAVYKDWELGLSDGSKLTGCISKYIVVKRLGAAYIELYLNVNDPVKCAAIIRGMRDRFATDPQFLLPEALRKNHIKIRQNENDVHTSYNQLPIVGAFTIYAECQLDLSAKLSLIEHWGLRGVQLTIVDQSFVEGKKRAVKPYAFICHSHKDKKRVAKPLAERLRKDVGPVWYDDYSLRVGDSLREGIEKGLRQSDRCIIVLSKNFLMNEGWTKREFDSICAREMIEKQKVILPLWVNVTPQDLYEFSPILADRVGVRWAEGIDVVCSKLAAVLRQSKP